MWTDSVQQQTIRTPQPYAGIFARAVVVARQFICGLHGHDALLHFGQGRLSLQCTSCGYESPGWDVSPRSEPEAPVVAQPAARLVRMPLIGHRRAA